MARFLDLTISDYGPDSEDFFDRLGEAKRAKFIVIINSNDSYSITQTTGLLLIK